MKLLLFLLLVSISLQVHCQQDSTPPKTSKGKPNMAILRMLDGAKIKGWFYTMNDSQITVLPIAAMKSKNFSGQKMMGKNYSVEYISSISLRKKNSGLKGALIGLGAGIVTGAIIGLASGNDPIETYSPANDPTGFGALAVALNNAFAMTAGEKALAMGAGLGIFGAATGAIIGAVAKKKFTIGGKKQRYRDMQSDLMARLMVVE